MIANLSSLPLRHAFSLEKKEIILVVPALLIKATPCLVTPSGTSLVAGSKHFSTYLTAHVPHIPTRDHC